MKLQQFNGGLNIRLHPSYIQQNEAVEYTNIDNAVGTLKSVAGSAITDIGVSKDCVYFDSKDIWVSFERETYTAEYANVLHYCDGLNTPKSFDGTTHYNMAIAAPTTKVKGTPTLAPPPVEVADFTPKTVTSTTAIQGKVAYYYIIKTKRTYDAYPGAMYVKVDADGTTTILGTEVRDERKPKLVDDSKARMTVRVSSTVDVADDEYAIVYRLYDGKYRQVTIFTENNQYFEDVTGNISHMPELDFTKFAKIIGVTQYVTTFYNSNTGAESGPSPLSDEIDCGDDGALEMLLEDIPVTTDPQVTGIRLYRIGGDMTNYTMISTIPIDAVSWYDFNKDIDGRILTTSGFGVPKSDMKYITESNSMLFGAVDNKLYFTLIDKPYAWPDLYYIAFSHTIVGIAKTAQGLLVMDKRKTYIVTGNSPSTLAKGVVSGDQGCVSHKSVQEFGASAVWVSSDGICVMSGGVINVVSKVSLGKIEINAVSSALHDEVYYVLDNLGQIYSVDFRYGVLFKKFVLPYKNIVTGADRLYGWLNGKLFELFKGTTLETLHYKSPLFIEGRATQNKYCKNVYIYINGDIIVKVYINSTLAIEKTLSGVGNMQIKVPNKSCYDIQFEITGTGEVREIFIEFSANDAS